MKTSLYSHGRTGLLLFCSVLAWAAFGCSVQAQYAINWYKVSGGGGSSSNGEYVVHGTIGQHDAGGPMTAGQYSVTGGFWALYALQTPGLPLLTINFIRPDSVVVSWLDTGTYTLQTNVNLDNPAAWGNYDGTVTTSGDTNSVTITPPIGNTFFRLKNP